MHTGIIYVLFRLVSTRTRSATSLVGGGQGKHPEIQRTALSVNVLYAWGNDLVTIDCCMYECMYVLFLISRYNVACISIMCMLQSKPVVWELFKEMYERNQKVKHQVNRSTKHKHMLN